MGKRRYINFRAFLIVAASLVFAAIFALLSFTVQPLGWTLFGAGLIFFFAMIFISLHRGDKKFKTLTYILCAVLFSAVFFNFIATVNLWQRETIIEDEKYSVSGTVDSVTESDGRLVIVLRDISIAEEKHKGKLKIYAPDEIRLMTMQAGDKVEIEHINLFKNNLIEDGKVNAYNKRTNIRYTANAFAGDVKFSAGKKNFFDSLGYSLRNLLINNLGKDYGSVAYGMLTGDRTGISQETSSAFNISGISHVLAVSGLHIGFVAAIITFILKKLKARRVPTFVTLTVFLFFYAFAASFSPSVVRAVIMTETGLAASVFGNRKDKLSALCFAVTVILVFSPLYLFEAGFQLSVGAVLGIILFADFFEKCLRKIKIPQFIASSVGVSVAVQPGILPALIYNFGEIQIYSVLTNVLLMPLIAATFCAVFISALLTAVLPFMSFTLKISGVPLMVLDKCATAVSSLPYAVVTLRATAAIFSAYPAYFFISRFFMLRKARLPVKIPLVLLCGVLIAHGAFALPPYRIDNAVIPVYSTDSVVSVVRRNGKTYVVGDLKSYYPVSETLKKYRISKIDAVYLTDLGEKSAAAAVKLMRGFDCDAVYSPENESIDGLGHLAENRVKNYYLLRTDENADSDIDCVFENGRFVCYSLAFSDKSVLFFGYGRDYANASYSLINSAAVIRAYEYTGAFSDRIFIVDSSFAGLQSPPLGISVFDKPDIVFDYVRGLYLCL